MRKPLQLNALDLAIHACVLRGLEVQFVPMEVLGKAAVEVRVVSRDNGRDRKSYYGQRAHIIDDLDTSHLPSLLAQYVNDAMTDIFALWKMDEARHRPEEDQ